MKFTTAKEHRDFFQKQGWITFEEIFSPSQYSSMIQLISNTLKQKLQTNLASGSPEILFREGFDLWRECPELKNLIIFPKLLDIVSELIDKEILRLGFDQFLPAWSGSQPSWVGNESIYGEFLNETASLKEISCIKGICGGILIPLNETTFSSENIDLFPHQKGQLTVLNAETPIPWPHLKGDRNQSFYLVAFADKNAIYQLNPKDPHTHVFKRWGYVFNDRLNETLNPIVYRS